MADTRMIGIGLGPNLQYEIWNDQGFEAPVDSSCGISSDQPGLGESIEYPVGRSSKENADS